MGLGARSKAKCMGRGAWGKEKGVWSWHIARALMMDLFQNISIYFFRHGAKSMGQGARSMEQDERIFKYFNFISKYFNLIELMSLQIIRFRLDN
jgi:hypothetical protein